MKNTSYSACILFSSSYHCVEGCKSFGRGLACKPRTDVRHGRRERWLICSAEPSRALFICCVHSSYFCTPSPWQLIDIQTSSQTPSWHLPMTANEGNEVNADTRRHPEQGTGCTGGNVKWEHYMRGYSVLAQYLQDINKHNCWKKKRSGLALCSLKQRNFSIILPLPTLHSDLSSPETGARSGH